jgi:ribosomal protein S27E
MAKPHDNEVPIHADMEDGSGYIETSPVAAWESSPNEEELVYLKDQQVYETEIPENYVQIRCAGCSHIFWVWLYQVQGNNVRCPKCHFPLNVKIKITHDHD